MPYALGTCCSERERSPLQIAGQILFRDISFCFPAPAPHAPASHAPAPHAPASYTICHLLLHCIYTYTYTYIYIYTCIYTHIHTHTTDISDHMLLAVGSRDSRAPSSPPRHLPPQTHAPTPTPPSLLAQPLPCPPFHLQQHQELREKRHKALA
jgi:hypothetical protein